MSEEINFCACMGPIGADEFCPCIMRSKGLEPTNLWTPEKITELEAALSKMCNWRKDE